MENEKNRRIPEAEETPEEKKFILQPGERVFAVVLLALGLVALYLSLKLWFKMPQPRVSSAAALPLFASGVWVLLALITLLQDFKLLSPLSGLATTAEKIKKGLQFAFPLDTVVVLGGILIYCLLLFLGVSFYIATPLFLYGCMCYLMRGNLVKNILWTAIVMAFIILVFRMLFSVVFPT